MRQVALNPSMAAPFGGVFTLCGETRGFYVTDRPSQRALREVRRIFSSQMTQMVLLAVVILLGISGPFGTLQSMTLGPRLAYWAVTAPLTFALGIFVSTITGEALRGKVAIWAARALSAGAAAFAIGICVTLLNWIAFGIAPLEISYVGPLLVSVIAAAAVIALAAQYLWDNASPAGAQINAPPALLERIELGKRGALISLSVQDHYVEVVTTKGTSLLLMRLSDAIRETGQIEGLQIHRSHWVALRQVTAARREGDRAVLTLADGRELPASRSNVKALKDAGILPK